ncbi:MAG: DUF4330 domain-containing protein [Oscillospiraceae bacterium]|nr:DUF4330 domain-containing protein [Oscillospiraceae bacterium]
MENNQKKRWRPNLFDFIFIAGVIIIAVVIISFSGRIGGGGGIISTGTQETVRYTLALERMIGDTATLISPGDQLIDRVENRSLGTVVSVEALPSTAFRTNYQTGERVLSEISGESAAIVVVEALATVTESQISVGGFVIRAGAHVSVNGPLYHGNGWIINIERGDAA